MDRSGGSIIFLLFYFGFYLSFLGFALLLSLFSYNSSDREGGFRRCFSIACLLARALALNMDSRSDLHSGPAFLLLVIFRALSFDKTKQYKCTFTKKKNCCSPRYLITVDHRLVDVGVVVLGVLYYEGIIRRFNLRPRLRCSASLNDLHQLQQPLPSSSSSSGDALVHDNAIDAFQPVFSCPTILLLVFFSI